MRKHLQKIIFIFAMSCCLSLSVSAQKPDESEKKVIRKPPAIVPDRDRKPKEEKPDEKESKKKPQSIISYLLAKVIDDDM